MEFCSPALIYLIFSITQLFFDLSNHMYNTAFMKLLVIILITILLNILCQRGQTTIAWLIVFIPFIFMSVIVGILLYIFGLNPTTGAVKLPPNVTTDPSGNVLVFDPYYDPRHHPVYYQSPNVVVPAPPPAPPAPYVPETKTVSGPNEDITVTTIPTSTETAAPAATAEDTTTTTTTTVVKI